MAGYTRVDTGNNIADGNVISAADLDNEFDGIQAAFNASTGHNHDGTTGEGAPILVLGPTQDVTISSSTILPKISATVDIGSSSLKFRELHLSGLASIDGTLSVTGVTTFTAQPVLSSLTANRAVFTNGTKGLVSNAITGTGNVVMSTSPTLVTPVLGTPSSVTLTNATGLPVATGISGLAAGVAAFLATPSSSNLATVVTDETGTGALVFANSPTLVTPALGTPSSATLTNATGLPVSTGISGLGTGVASALAVNVGTAGAPVVNGGALGTPSSATLTNATGLPVSTGVSGLGTGVATFLATPSSANLRSAVTDETGTGALVFANSPTLVSPALGTPSSGVVTNLTGTASININGTVGATTPNTGAFTTLSASGAVTLNGGTANGVAYLNGSKVLTTGSALTFDGTNLGIGTSSPGAKLDVNGQALVRGLANKNTAPAGTGYTYFDIGTDTDGSVRSNIIASFSGTSSTLEFGTSISGTRAERMRIDASGNVGIGTSSPNTKLQVAGVIRGEAIGGEGGHVELLNTTNTAVAGMFDVDAGNQTRLYSLLNTPLLFGTNSVERLRIDSSGNVGVGTSSPSTKLDVRGPSGGVLLNIQENDSGNSRRVRISNSGTVNTIESTTGIGSTQLAFSVDGFERARIDSSGNLLVGTTSAYGTTGLTLGTTSSSGIWSATASSSGVLHMRFYNPNGVVGSISTNGTATTYATSSDYRLKENIQPMTGALSLVSALKPCTYNWKSDGSDGQGFIAHELQAVVPDAVVGEKDAVDTEGKPVYQGIDTSFLVATLTAAIQEQQAIITALTARVAALESN